MEATKQTSMYVPAGLYWTIQWKQKHAMKQPWRSVYCTITIQVKWVWSASWLKWISHEGLCYQVCQELWWCRWCCWGFSEEDLLEDKQRGHSHPNHILFPVKIQVHLNKLECREKVIFFLQVISKSETFIYFRFIACKVKHFKSFFFVLILMIRAYSSWKSKITISKY